VSDDSDQNLPVLREVITSRNAARPFLGIAIETDLISLRRVNSFQANFDIADHQSVTVDNPRDARDVRSLGGPAKKRMQGAGLANPSSTAAMAE
jgi:hypothetical protein